MKLVSAIILITISAENNSDIITGDIDNVYLNTNTELNIYTHAVTEFELVDIIYEEGLLEVAKALYGLPTSGNRWHVHIFHTLRAIRFNPTRFDPDVWIRGGEGGCDYIGAHIDNDIVVAVKPTYIFNKLKDTYKIKAFVPPKVHIGCDYLKFKKGTTN